MKQLIALLVLIFNLPVYSQTQKERLATAEAQIAASVCGAWSPGTGLTINKDVRRGWIHSLVPGKHTLHVSKGQIYIFNQPTNEFVQLPGQGPIITTGYHQIHIETPEDVVLEWTLPNGKREPIPVLFLYPAS